MKTLEDAEKKYDDKSRAESGSVRDSTRDTDTIGEYDRLIFAVLQGEDRASAVDELNENGFFVTILNSTGGFFKKKNVTIMIGLPQKRLEEALYILERTAGQRMETVFQPIPASHGMPMIPTPEVAVQTKVGGVTVFVTELSQMRKY